MIEILPYIEIDGIRTHKDSLIKDLYRTIINEGHGYIFNDGSISSEDNFLYVMKYQSQLYLLYWGKELVAICWLNRIKNKTARIHWCGLNNTPINKLVKIGKHFLKEIMNITLSDGSYMFDVIYGHTPKSNKKAVRFAQISGMKIVGEVPYLYWNEENGKGESCVISYYVRGKEHENL